MADREGKTFHILLVEDDPGDVRLAIEAFRRSRVNSLLSVVGNGAEALGYLRREYPYARAPVPDLILLDLNLPRVNGHEVLREAKADPSLRRIPVVVLSVSASEEDVRRAYDTQANCYVVKPADWGLYRSVLQAVERFWLNCVRLPSGP